MILFLTLQSPHTYLCTMYVNDTHTHTLHRVYVESRPRHSHFTFVQCENIAKKHCNTIRYILNLHRFVLCHVMKEGMSKMVHRRQKRRENIIEINGEAIKKNDNFLCCCWCRCHSTEHGRAKKKKKKIKKLLFVQSGLTVCWSGEQIRQALYIHIICATRALLNFCRHHCKDVLAPCRINERRTIAHLLWLETRKKQIPKHSQSVSECIIISVSHLCRVSTACR